jgi:integrase
MPAPMIKTKTPGVFKRGARYVVVYYVDGRQKKESSRSYDDARRLKSARQADVARGEFHERTNEVFRDYALEWVERYQGRGRRGCRETTRDEYRRLLRAHVLPYFGDRLRLADITPRRLANFIGWLCDEMQQGKRLSDSTIGNILDPVRSCLRTAVQEGLIRHNPAHDLSLPHRPQPDGEDDEDEARAFSRDELVAFLAVVNPRHKLLFRLLAATGLRVSEVMALEWRHLHLAGSHPHVKVRRALVKGRMNMPKGHSRREVPLAYDLVTALSTARRSSDWGRDNDPVFASLKGTPLNADNLRRRVVQPVVEEIGAPWASFHTFRHTCASLLFSRGANAVQVQRWLGHHSAAFTLATYVHLLPGELGSALALDDELMDGGNDVATEPTGLPGNDPDTLDVEMLLQAVGPDSTGRHGYSATAS